MFFRIHSSYSNNHPQNAAHPAGRVWENGQRLTTYEAAHEAVESYLKEVGGAKDLADWNATAMPRVAVVGLDSKEPGLESIYIQEMSEEPATVSLELND